LYLLKGHTCLKQAHTILLLKDLLIRGGDMMKCVIRFRVESRDDPEEVEDYVLNHMFQSIRPLDLPTYDCDSAPAFHHGGRGGFAWRL
jgi:hypothetical protein